MSIPIKHRLTFAFIFAFAFIFGVIAIVSVFAQTSDTTAPVISGVHSENIIGDGAQIGWDTDDPSDSRVAYGTSPNNYTFFSDRRCDAGGNVTDHCVNLTGLSGDTTYYYKVESMNADGLDTHSDGYQFISAQSSQSSLDNTAPVISNVRTEVITINSAEIKWDTDDLSNSEVAYDTSPNTYALFSNTRCDGGGDVTSHCVTLTGLDANTTYYYEVESTNTAGLEVSYEGYQFTSANESGSDNSPPTTPGIPTPIPNSSYIIDLSWTASTDDVGVVGYKLYRDSVFIADVSSTSYSDIGLSSDTTYSYTVEAYDAAGNISPLSSTAAATTGSSDPSYPSTPTNLIATAISSSQIDISWTASTDDVGVTYYNVHRDGSYIGQTVSAFYSDSDFLSANTTYNYTVVAYDTDQNLSPFSQPASVTTPGSGEGPDTTPPYVNDFGHFTEEDGRLEANFNFSEDVDQNKLTDSNIYIVLASDGSKVPGTIKTYPPIGVGYVTSEPVQSGVDYQLVVKKNIKDLAGNEMTADYLSPTFQASTFTPPVDGFHVEYDLTFPMDGSTGIGTNEVIHIEFNEAFDPATVEQSFVLTTLADPNVSISGTFNIFTKDFVFVPSAPLSPNITYTYKILTSLKNLNGMSLEFEFFSSFTTGGSTTEEGAKITGTIFDPGINPVANAFVEIHTRDYSLSRDAQADTNGKYTVFNIPPGTYLLDVYPPQNQSNLTSPPPIELTLTAGQTLTQDITFINSTKFIKGRVVRKDGSAVTDAGIGAFRSGTNGWSEARTDSSGNYTLSVQGGSWEVMVFPMSSIPDWAYDQPPQVVEFALDETAEEKTLNFTVSSVDAAVKGKILLPNGTPPPQDTVFGGFRSSEGFEFGGPVDSTGSFQVSLKAGTYQVFIHSEDPRFTSPSISPITIETGETKDIGTITLITKDDHIKGTVTDQNGAGIANVRIDAYAEGFEYATTETDSSGAFDVLVTTGKWEVIAIPDPTTNLYNPEPPKRIEVAPGITATINFILFSADAGISGTVVDKNGDVLSDLYGFTDLSKETFGFDFDHGPGIGGPIDRGIFSFKAPAGEYLLNTFLSPDSSYTAGEPQFVTLISGETLNVKITVNENTSIITGVLKDGAGKVIAGVDAEVFATTKTGIWQGGLIDRATGKYTLRVAAGVWVLGYYIDPSSGYISLGNPDIEVIVKEGETVTKDLIVTKVGSKITGRVVDPDGEGIPHVFIEISKTSFGGLGNVLFGEEEFKNIFIGGGETDSTGSYTIPVPAGSYFIKTFVPPDLKLLSSEEKEVTVAEGDTATIDLTLRRTDLTITGRVLTNGASVVPNAFVWAWSPQGGYQESPSFSDGTFVLNVTASSTWRISAGAEIDGAFYRSSEIPVVVGTESAHQDIDITKISDLPSSAIKTTDATKPTVVEVKEGLKVAAPANAVSTAGSVSISITPDTRAPSQGETKVVGVAYDLEARDAGGQIVSTFNTEVTITIPYKESDLLDLGANENELVISFWDETVGKWSYLKNSIVNKEENVVTATTIHFTRFAIVAPADATPPNAPTNIAVVQGVAGGLGITWVNPTKDFDHIKIYRSTSKKELGDIAANDIVATTFTDGGVSKGVMYYYTVRAVDPAGNESVNTDQVSALAAAEAKIAPIPIVPVAGTLNRNLKVGSSGDDVKTLQQLLINEGVYPEALVTGYFGQLTRAAIIKFQDKYRSDVLTPVGLAKGTGFFGPSTRARANALLKVTELKEALPQAPGLGVAFSRLERNLTVGSVGNDVKNLQQFLNAQGIKLAESGPGSPGNETTYFGTITRTAVMRFQEKYAGEVLLPIGLSKGTGFVGPMTLKKMNQLLK